MKRFTIFAITALIVFTAFSYAVFAEDEEYETRIDSVSNQYSVNDTFYAKASIVNIKNDNGFIGVELVIDYDPTVLTVVPEDDGKYLTVNLPNQWVEGDSTVWNVLKDDNGNEIGKIIVVSETPALSDLVKEDSTDITPSDLIDKALKTNDYFVSVRFKCLKSCDTTSITIDANESGNACTSINKKGEVTNCKGKGSTLDIKVVDTSSDKEGNSPTVYIIIAVIGAVLVAGAAFFLIRKKK